ncbi:MAG TPA: hypothetical protein VG318_05300 [Actinomycetota bacterium]|nr:hypothetical protein [Actinomycetota bacterium]
MKKTIVSLTAAALVAGSLGVTAHAKKPAGIDFFLRGPDCSAAVLGLSVVDGPGDGTCGGAENGAVNGVSGQTGAQPMVEQAWMAFDGLPLVLDASKPVTGKLYITSFLGRSAGPATLDVVVEAEVGDKSVDVGSATVDYLVTPAQSWTEVTFEIDVPDKLNKKKVTGLTMRTTSRGFAPLQGYFHMENPASFITIPAFK